MNNNMMKKELQEYFDNNSQIADEEFFQGTIEQTVIIENICSAVCVDNSNLSNSEYEMTSVWKFSDDLYIEFYGLWVSHDGPYYEGFHFVKPKQKTITVWE